MILTRYRANRKAAIQDRGKGFDSPLWSALRVPTDRAELVAELAAIMDSNDEQALLYAQALQLLETAETASELIYAGFVCGVLAEREALLPLADSVARNRQKSSVRNRMKIAPWLRDLMEWKVNNPGNRNFSQAVRYAARCNGISEHTIRAKFRRRPFWWKWGRQRIQAILDDNATFRAYVLACPNKPEET